jgi:hypothetical protein
MFIGYKFKRSSSWFHTPKFALGINAKLDERKRIMNIFQQVAKYNVHMTNILFILFDLEIKNNQIIEEKDKFVHNLQPRLWRRSKSSKQSCRIGIVKIVMH